MNFESTVVHESKTHPGVTFTVRVLNRIQRARRDEKIAVARRKVAELVGESQKVPDLDRRAREIVGEAVDEKRKLTADERAEVDKISADPAVIDARTRRRILNDESELIWEAEFKPAYIRAGLISVNGLEIAGQPATAESLIEQSQADLDDLIDEIYKACELASGLSAEQLKNSPSPGASEPPEAGQTSSTTATSAP